MKNSRKTYIIVSSVVFLIALLSSIFFYKMFSITLFFPVFGIPSEKDIESYGRDKFVGQSLDFNITGVPNKEFMNHFKPKRMQTHGDGVLLIYGENRKYIKGLYVDPNDFTEGIYGSGTSIIPRSKHIGWAEIKKRIYSNENIKPIGVAHSIYSNDYKEAHFVDPNDKVNSSENKNE